MHKILTTLFFAMTCAASHSFGMVALSVNECAEDMNPPQMTRDAYLETEALENTIRDAEFASEVGAFGLTKEIMGKETVVEFVHPDPNKTIIFETDLFSVKQSKELIEMFSENRTTTVTRTGDKAVFSAGESRLEISDIHWPYVRDILEKVFERPIPEDLPSFLGELGNPIRMENRYEVIITSSSVSFLDAYWNRLQERARETGSSIAYNMHHHPHFGLAIGIFDGKPMEKQVEYYDKLLRPSLQDIKTLESLGVTHMEIRAFGKPGDLANRDVTTKKSYNIRRIQALAKDFKMIVEGYIECETTGTPPNETLIRHTLEMMQAAHHMNVGLDVISKYTFGEREAALKSKYADYYNTDNPTQRMLYALLVSRNR